MIARNESEFEKFQVDSSIPNLKENCTIFLLRNPLMNDNAHIQHWKLRVLYSTVLKVDVCVFVFNFFISIIYVCQMCLCKHAKVLRISCLNPSVKKYLAKKSTFNSRNTTEKK